MINARPRRMNRLTGLLLLAAAAAAIVPTAPAVIRLVTAGGAAPARGAGKIAQLLPRDRSRDDLDGARSALPDLDDGNDNGPASPHEAAPDDDAAGTPACLRIGIAPRGLKLLDEPSATSARVGEIAAGELVMIVKESGGWAFIARNGADGVLTGWAPRSEIAVR